MYKPTILEEDQIISKLKEVGVKNNYGSNKSIKYFYKQLMINPINYHLIRTVLMLKMAIPCGKNPYLSAHLRR